VNFIGLDPSLISTAMVVNGKLYNYCRERDAVNKSGLSKWFRYCEDKINLRFIEYRDYESYSEGELVKLKDYDKITDQIISDIESNIDRTKPTKIGIEGYSYSSDAGAIIDLVTFSTLLRKKLWDHISKDITVFSPSTLKLESCKLTYPPINEGKKKDKWVYKNAYGISGGNLTKHGMFMCIVDNNELRDDWSNLCRTMKDDIMGASKVPKPFEDANDSWLLYQILKKNL
jgi:hypothetical protein